MIVAPAQLSGFLGRMEPVIDELIDRLSKTEFRDDPIGGAKYARATSIMSSAYKRHGQLLGRAILERLKDCHRVHAWTEGEFKLSHASAAEVSKGMPPTTYRSFHLPYGEAAHSGPVDLIVHCQSAGTIRAYNIKRGNGLYDGGKRRLMMSELLRTQMLLLDYGRQLGVEADEAQAYMIFYYGLRSIPEPFSLTGSDLDAHFEFPIQEAVELVNDRFRTRLHAMIEGS